MAGRRKGRRQIKRNNLGVSLPEERYQPTSYKAYQRKRGAISHSVRSYVQQASLNTMDIHGGVRQINHISLGQATG